MTDTFVPTMATGLDVRPMAGHIGAEIFGVDISEPIEPSTVAEIRAALLKWKVIFFRDQDVTQAQHVAFARLFGEVESGHPTLPSEFPEYPEIFLLDNRKLPGVGERKDDMAGPHLESSWHTDLTFVPKPSDGAILRGVVIPPFGGDTQWTNLAVAYERLSKPLQDAVNGLTAVHDDTRTYRAGATAPPKFSVHPVVRVHPETGERVLFVNPNFTHQVVGLSKKESHHLLALLFAHITDPEFTVRFRWQRNSIAFWDNRCTAHLIATDVPHGMHRSMERVSLVGDVPEGPGGFRSYAIDSNT